MRQTIRPLQCPTRAFAIAHAIFNKNACIELANYNGEGQRDATNQDDFESTGR